jgi:hypothetical protein
MISSIVIDGALKLVSIIRYGKHSNRPDVARIYDPRATVPEKVLNCSKYDGGLFIDDETGQQYKETKLGLVAIK